VAQEIVSAFDSPVLAPAGPRERPSTILGVAVWLALISGLAQAVVLMVERIGFDRFIRHGPEVMWMAPLVHLVLFGAVAAALVLGSRVWPAVGSLRVTVFACACLGYAGLLFLVTQLSLWAVVLLAIGLAAQTARLAAAHRRGFLRAVGWSLRWRPRRRAAARRDHSADGAEAAALDRRDFLVGATVPIAGLAGGIAGWNWMAERRAVARRVASPGGSPNVILIVLDTVRADSLGLYGRRRRTSPNLEALASGGVVFDRAFATAPWTLPSHASLLTGHYPHTLTANWHDALDRSQPTLAEVFGSCGYRTAGFIGNKLYCQAETGLARGFDHYSDYPPTIPETIVSSTLGRFVGNSHQLRNLIGRHGVLTTTSAEEINGRAVRWAADQREPFFLFLNYFDAHEPYFPPAPFDDMFGTAALRRTSLTRYWDRQGGRLDKKTMPPEEVEAERDAYEGCLAYLDHQIGQLIDDFRRRDLLANTVVVVTADHGEQFGEHGLFGHGNSLYLPLLHVPLIVHGEGRVPAKVRIGSSVSLRDVAATLIDVAGIAPAVTLPGVSLAGQWREGVGAGPTSPILAQVRFSSELPSYTPASAGDMRSIISDDYHYIAGAKSREELYRWRDDPSESRDLAASADHAEIRAQLSARVSTLASQ
jgi:arylsulfatase A-like enzyme